MWRCCANGATHESLGQRPRNLDLPRFGALKARLKGPSDQPAHTLSNRGPTRAPMSRAFSANDLGTHESWGDAPGSNEKRRWR